MSATETRNVKVGDSAPDFTLPVRNADGTRGELQLSSLRGRPVVLFFYPKADTPG
jgi:thioredoxin-dependent peroxiredoxin